VLSLAEPDGARAGRLAADVDDIRTGVTQRPGVGQGRPDGEVPLRRRTDPASY